MATEEVLVAYDEIIVNRPDRDGAALYNIDGKEIWIPYSVHARFGDGTILIERWFAEKEELI